MFDDSGQLKKRREFDADGRAKLVPMVRPAGTKTPCWNCPKCDWPNNTPADGRKAELNERNWKAWRFYWEREGCELDGIARRNCGIIAELIAEHERGRSRAVIELLKVR